MPLLLGTYHKHNLSIMPRRRYSNPDVYDYIRTMKSFLATTRFNDATWRENQAFVKKSVEDGTLSTKVQCLYPCSVAIGESVPMSANVFVLEMNNDTNLVMGIGLIKNTMPAFHKYTVYSEDKYNTYVYQGAYHIPRENLNDDELKVLRLLEHCCFKGKRHQKRMQGIKVFPHDMLYDCYKDGGQDLVQEIAGMFKHRFMS